MASISAHVQAQLHAAKAAIDQAYQQVQDLDGMMDSLDHEFDTFTSHLLSETQQHLKLLNGLTSQCHVLDSELTQVFTELSSAMHTAEGQLGGEVAELEKEGGNLLRWNDGFIHMLEESDHTVEQVVQDVGHVADEVSHKVGEAAHHIIEIGEQTANKFGNELVHHVKGLHDKVDQIYHGFEQEATNRLHDLEHEVSNYSTHLVEQAQHFAEHAQHAGHEAKEKLMSSVHELENGVVGHLTDLSHNVQHFHDSFMKMAEFVTNLTTEGIEVVGELGHAMDATNVGLNGVAKTVSNVKEILDEISI